MDVVPTHVLTLLQVDHLAPPTRIIAAEVVASPAVPPCFKQRPELLVDKEVELGLDKDFRHQLVSKDRTRGATLARKRLVAILTGSI
jgi:hypothetical protein